MEPRRAKIAIRRFSERAPSNLNPAAGPVLNSDNYCQAGRASLSRGTSDCRTMILVRACSSGISSFRRLGQSLPLALAIETNRVK